MAAEDSSTPSTRQGVEYFIRPLSAPMHLGRTGELCPVLQFRPGTTLTLGRSKKICDLVFPDTRVSRKHCQLRLTSDCHFLILINGVTVPGSYFPMPHRKDSGDDEFGVGDHSFQPSLNGIFVNGKQFVRRSMVLTFGDEVSLVGPTDAGKSLEPGCKLAVGFTVETRPNVLSSKKRRVLSSQPLSQVVTAADRIGTSERFAISRAVRVFEGGFSLSHDCHSHINAFTRKEEFDLKSESQHLSPYDPIDCGSAGEFYYLNSRTRKVKSQSLNKKNNNVEKKSVIKHSTDGTVDSSVNHGTINLNIRNVRKTTNMSGEIERKLLSASNLVQASMHLRTTLLGDLESSAFVQNSQTLPSSVDSNINPGKEGRQPQLLLEKDNTSRFTMLAVEVISNENDNQVMVEHGNSVCEKDLIVNPEQPTVIVDSTMKLMPQQFLSQKSTNPSETLEKTRSVEIDSIEKDIWSLRKSKGEHELTSLSTDYVNDIGKNNSTEVNDSFNVPMKHLEILYEIATELSEMPSGDISIRGREALTSSDEPVLIDHESHFKSENKLKQEATEAVIDLGHEDLRMDSINDHYKALHGNSVRGIRSKCHEMVAATEFIEKEKLVKLNEEHIRDCLFDEKSATPAMLSEAILLCVGDQHRYMNCQDVSHGGSTMPKISSCHNACKEFQVIKGQSKEVVCKVSIAEISKLNGESVHSLWLDDVEFHHGASVLNGANKSGTTENEIINRFSGFLSLENSNNVRDKDNLSNQNLVVPEIAFDSCKRNPNSVATGFRRKEPSSGASKESKSESNSSQSLSAALAESNSELCTNGCLTDANEEQGEKKNHDFSETSMESMQCKRTIPLKMKESCHMKYQQNQMSNPQVSERGTNMDCNSDSFGYFLNKLNGIPDGLSKTVSLDDLLAPIHEIKALFITTFTYDVEWFLSFSGISSDIPITIVCHDAQRCFSSSVEDNCEKPFLDWPNVTLVYPPFPKVSSFGKGQGIGCHHPKVFLQFRSESIRVVISSANLSFKQWFHVTNNVWWQDFPRLEAPDFYSLFQHYFSSSNNIGDFASQLAIFLAHLLENAPSEAHWITDIAAFDFSLAAGYLIASVPGIHHRLYENTPRVCMTLEHGSSIFSQHEFEHTHKKLGIVQTTVAGVKYRFCPAADQNGLRIRSLAAVLNVFGNSDGSAMPVLLKRARNLPADPNAMSVVVTSHGSRDLFPQKDLQSADIESLEFNAFNYEQSFIKLGFLPRGVASWLALLCDEGFFSFAAYICPTEALAVASGKSVESLRLTLYVFEGPKFSELSTISLTNEELVAFGGLFRSLHNRWGIWRMEQVLSRYKWIDSHETDFFVASSSIGTSLDSKFLAAFAAAAGRRAETFNTYSQDSDPEWGCWTAEHEAANPSIRIVFPTINRVKRNLSHHGLLCFAESAWLRLKPSRLLHDAIPYPSEREGFPMHVKVVRRRFQESSTCRPYGWFYCGSHNFSPAAWGRPTWKVGDYEPSMTILGSSIHISNYELGILFVEPPYSRSSRNAHEHPDEMGLDKFIMPFKLPPPIYSDTDRPATRRAMMEFYLELKEMELKRDEETDAAIFPDEIHVEDVDYVQEPKEVPSDHKEGETEAEKVYVEALWSQIEEERL